MVGRRQGESEGEGEGETDRQTDRQHELERKGPGTRVHPNDSLSSLRSHLLSFHHLPITAPDYESINRLTH